MTAEGGLRCFGFSIVQEFIYFFGISSLSQGEFLDGWNDCGWDKLLWELDLVDEQSSKMLENWEKLDLK